jgi:hypothetical protein
MITLMKQMGSVLSIFAQHAGQSLRFSRLGFSLVGNHAGILLALYTGNPKRVIHGFGNCGVKSKLLIR